MPTEQLTQTLGSPPASRSFKQSLINLPATTVLVVLGIALLPALLVRKIWPWIKAAVRWVARIGRKALHGILLWWITSRAIWRDRRKSVTDDPILARLMLGRFGEEDGLFLSYAPAIPILNVPKRS